MIFKCFRSLCLLVFCTGIISAASIPTTPDITVEEIPQFQSEGKEELKGKLTLSPDFLKFCRLSIFTIPMDPKACDLELNQGIPIPIIARRVMTFHILMSTLCRYEKIEYLYTVI